MKISCCNKHCAYLSGEMLNILLLLLRNTHITFATGMHKKECKFESVLPAQRKNVLK